MSLSRASLVERAWLRNQSNGGMSIPVARYDAHVNQALALMAQMIASDPDERVRNQLKKDFSITVTSGSGSLTSAVTGSEPLMDQTLDKATITSSDSSYPWQYISTYEELSLGRPTFGLIFYTVKGSNLIATNTSGALNSLSTTATVNGNYVPAASSLSGILDLEEMAVRVLANLVKNEPAAQQQN